MTYWVRTFHNPFNQRTYQVTSDEQYLPNLWRRIVELGHNSEWEDESKYVLQFSEQFDGAAPKVDLVELPEGRKV
jgi:hypothetical protein